MTKANNEIYSLIDEEFVSNFQGNQKAFMEDVYYSFYQSYSKRISKKSLSKEEFFTNMHRRRVQIYQLCCPFCESVFHLIHDKKIQKNAGFNYCPNCGRASAAINAQKQIDRFVRIHSVNKMGLKQWEIKTPNTEKWLLGYDCYQMELVELASIIEVVFRGYFEALFFIHNFGFSNQYTKRIVSKQTGNDFMNIEKANDIYKKAFEINIRENLQPNVWNDLIDIVNLRNMMVHNNGNIDEHFKKTPSFARCKDHIIGPFYKLEENDITVYLKSVISAVTEITHLYYQKYFALRNTVIANYYFNHHEMLDS